MTGLSAGVPRHTTAHSGPGGAGQRRHFTKGTGQGRAVAPPTIPPPPLEPLSQICCCCRSPGPFMIPASYPPAPTLCRHHVGGRRHAVQPRAGLLPRQQALGKALGPDQRQPLLPRPVSKMVEGHLVGSRRSRRSSAGVGAGVGGGVGGAGKVRRAAGGPARHEGGAALELGTAGVVLALVGVAAARPGDGRRWGRLAGSVGCGASELATCRPRACRPRGPEAAAYAPAACQHPSRTRAALMGTPNV